MEKMIFAKGFSPKKWKELVNKYKRISNTNQITELEWAELKSFLKKHVESLLWNKMESGAHSEENLGESAIDYYTEETINRHLAGIRNWDYNAHTFIEELVQTVSSIMSAEVNKYRRRIGAVKETEIESEETPFTDQINDTTKRGMQFTYGEVESVSDSYKGNPIGILTVEKIDRLIKGFFDGDEHMVLYIKLRHRNWIRGDIIDFFIKHYNLGKKQATTLVDRLSKKYKYNILDNPTRRKTIIDNLYELVASQNKAYERLIDELFKDVDEHREEFVNELGEWFGDIEEWLDIDDFETVSHTHFYEVVDRNQIQTSDNFYAARIQYNKHEKIVILKTTKSELSLIGIYSTEEALKQFDYKEDTEVSAELEKWLFAELKSFKENPFQ